MRRRWILAAFLTLMMYAAPARAASVSFDNLTDQGGGLFSLEANISGALDLFSFGFDVIYDPALVGFTATEGTFLSNVPGATTDFGVVPFDPSDPTVIPMSVVGSILGAFQSASGDGLLATLLFQLKPSVSTAVVQFGNPLFFDSRLNLIDVQLSPESLRLGEQSTVPEPSTIFLLGIGLAAVARRRLRRV